MAPAHFYLGNASSPQIDILYHKQAAFALLPLTQIPSAMTAEDSVTNHNIVPLETGWNIFPYQKLWGL